jgi:hypothetical protein
MSSIALIISSPDRKEGDEKPQQAARDGSDVEQ